MELIKINQQAINGNAVQTVNARELHAFLEVKTRFNDWIKKRIEEYGFVEGVDFVKFELPAGMKMSENGGEIGGIGNAQKNVALESMGYESFGQQGRIEYAISLNMAKELAMVERNEKGKQARQYFIECERKAQSPALTPANLSRMQLIQLAMEAEQERQALENKVEEMRPDCEAFARIAVSEGSMSLTDAAKALQVQPKAFFAWLSANGWIYRRLGTNWIAYQEKIQQGLLEHKVTIVQRDDGSEKSVHQVRVTPKGIAKLSRLLNEKEAA
ncbi:MAG: phage antirepressor KilAC domain-containing protein [Alistipes senegalensis]|nr:phage antirepressor KilAC domain-containing protein [Oxalobacter formigenes]MCM1280946.1 phage antirepressor KilAC domain-containing protein [Alistipes senegalensis]